MRNTLIGFLVVGLVAVLVLGCTMKAAKAQRVDKVTAVEAMFEESR